jgi:hypothetical protein
MRDLPQKTASRQQELFRQPPATWAVLFAFGLGTRVVIVLLGCLLARPSHPPWLDARDPSGNPTVNTTYLDASSAGGRRWIAPWYRWDGLWYAEICERGYSYEPGKQSSVAFLPLLPLLMSAGATVGLDPYWVGLVLPNLAFAAGLAFFGRAVLRFTGDAGVAWRAAVLVVAYPWSFFFSAPYQESLGFALTAAALCAWLARRPFWAALCLAGASAARLTAAAFSVALLAEWVNDVIRRRPARHAAWLVALAGAVGFGLFSLYLYGRFGDPFLYLRSHQAGGWDRQPPSLANMVRCLLAVPLGWVGPQWIPDYCVMLLVLGLGVRTWWKRGPFWGCLVLVPVLQAMASGTILSMGRIALAAYPVTIEVAALLGRPTLFLGCVILCVALQVLLISLYVNWYLVG